MKPMQSILALVLATVIAGGAYMAGRASRPEPMASTHTASVQDGRKVLYWYDPMRPDAHFDKPGKSPFMDMQLVPMYDEPQAQGDAVTIDPRMMQNLGVRTVKAEMGVLPRRLDTVAEVQPDERRIVVVQSRVAGWVERLRVKAVNDPVRKGELLAQVYAPDLLSAQEEYLLLRKDGRDPELTRAAHEKMRLLGVSEPQIERLQQTGRAQQRVAFYAPINGIVSDLGVREGAQVSPGMSLFSLTDLSTVWVTAQIPESEGQWLRRGDDATITLPGGTVYHGRVDYLYPQVTSVTRTTAARIRLANSHGLLRPGMFVHALLQAKAAQPVLLVPSEAVIRNGRRNVVIVADGGGKFHPVAVVIGANAGGRTEIVKGLSAGQTVVASAQFLIDSESDIRAGLDRLQGPAAAPTPTANAAPPVIHHGHGRIDRVDLKTRTVTLSHQPIASLHWPAMTMGFGVAPRVPLDRLQVGNEVDFDLVETKPGQYTIMRIGPAQTRTDR